MLLLSKILVVLVPLTTVGSAHAGGQDVSNAGGAHKALAQLVNQALARNPSYEVLGARMEQVEALRRQAESLFAADPALELRHNNDGFMDSAGLEEWEWGVELPLWLPGQKRARELVAERGGQAVASASLALKLSVAGLVREAIWESALAENQKEIAKREWDVALRLEKDVGKRVRYGDLARADLVLASQETLLRETASKRSVNDYQNALYRFQILTGAALPPRGVTEQAQTVRPITEQHPLLAKAHAEVVRALAERRQVQGERWASPTLTIGTRHERENDNAQVADSFGAILRLPLGLASQTAPALARAELALAEAEAELETLRRRLRLALDQAVRELDTTRAELALAEARQLLAAESLKLAQRSFALGEDNLVSLIRVQGQAFAADRTYRQTRLELGRNIARLNQALGILP